MPQSYTPSNVEEKSKVSKKYILPVVISLAVVVVLSTIVAIALNPKVQLAGGDNALKMYLRTGIRICKTDNCVLAAKYIKGNMNLTADPCNDYYNYICGGWLQSNKAYDHTNTWSVDDPERIRITKKIIELLSSKKPSEITAVENAKLFFKTCVKIRPLTETEGIKTVVKDFGGFPMFDQKTYNREIPWFIRTARIMRHFGVYNEEHGFSNGIFFNIGFNQDAGRIRFFAPRYYYQELHYYNDTNYKKLVQKSLCTVLKLTCTQKEKVYIKKRIDGMVEFQLTMATLVEVRGVDRQMSLKEFNAMLPNLHPLEFLKHLLGDSLPNLNANTTVSVQSLGYFGNLSKLLKVTKREIVDDFIGWSNFEILQYTTSPAISFKEYRHLNTETDEKTKRKYICYMWTDKSFKFAISRLFVDHFLHYRHWKKLHKMAQNLKHSFMKMIKRKKWLTKSSKAEALKKVNLMKFDIGYPAWLKNNLVLDKYYGLSNPLPTASVIEMLKATLSFHIDEEIVRFNYPLYKDSDWRYMPPHVTGALYNPSRNSFILPAVYGIPPFFWVNTTKALSFGSKFAIVVGHEITHSLDTDGSGYDAFGNPSNGFDKKSRTAFVKKADCLVNQYSRVIDPVTNMSLDGAKSVGEDMADFGSLKMVHQAYVINGEQDERLPGLENITHKQLFFIGLAMSMCGRYSKKELARLIDSDMHTPLNYRVVIPPSNIKEFAKAFSCSEGSQMNRKDKCIIW